MQPVWRAENTQKGRYREFLQCDADCIGIDSPLADAEMLVVAVEAIQSVGLKNLKVLVNDRTIFDEIPAKAIGIIDKLGKIGADGVKTELEKAGFDPAILTQLLLKKPSTRLETILSYAKQLGIAESMLSFDPTLARGLDYYTGMIFEIVIPDSGMGSVAGGGRYDKLIGMFAGTDIPAVGFAIGFDRIMDILNENPASLPPDTTPRVLVSVFQPELLASSIDVYVSLMKNGISAELYLEPTAKLEKQLRYADRKSLTHVIVVGPEEIKNGVITIKRLVDKQQTTQSVDACIEQLTAREPS
jgi:histidyl-tRNA synthetase